MVHILLDPALLDRFSLLFLQILQFHLCVSDVFIFSEHLAFFVGSDFVCSSLVVITITFKKIKTIASNKSKLEYYQEREYVHVLEK